jgi:DNA repair protein RecN (Recombination protein N)
MIKSIHIQNFALAHSLSIEFNKGLNILTGETGTGKSILIGAISAVLGARVYSEIVRTGADKATVEAIFEIEKLTELQALLNKKGLESNSEMILRREIPVKGNSRAFINDIPITVATLAEIGDLLVDIHSQNEHQSLLKKETHRYFIDEIGELNILLEKTATAYQAVIEAESHLSDLENRMRTMDEKYELYQFQLQEIEKSHLEKDEDHQLESERNILANSEKIFSLASQFGDILEGAEDENVAQKIQQALHILNDLAKFSQEIKILSQEFASAQIIIQEAARSIEAFQSKIEFDPKRLEEIELRLAHITALKKKYGQTIDDILVYKDKIESELHFRENIDYEVEKSRKQLQERILVYSEIANKLSKARKKVGIQLEKEVSTKLKEIGMPKIRFQVAFSRRETEDGIYIQDEKYYAGDENGIDEIEFYISPNPGEDFKPLMKIASGGEISRIMLALKNILAESDRIPLLIFDEIDAGVSGQIALAVGRSIHNLAHSHQIICITHLPQIASFGRSHYRVEKDVADGRTFTRVTALDSDSRVEEIASLMGGKTLTDEILQSARQLMQEAEENPDES